jgi:hypothetical protein
MTGAIAPLAHPQNLALPIGRYVGMWSTDELLGGRDVSNLATSVFSGNCGRNNLKLWPSVDRIFVAQINRLMKLLYVFLRLHCGKLMVKKVKFN